MNEIEIKGRLSGKQNDKLKYLLNMMYKPSEIAEEIGFDKRNFYRVYIPLGLPHERDNNNRIWINGIVFKDWINALYIKTKMDNKEAFCLSCKKSVEIVNPRWKEKKGIFFLNCECQNCGRILTKITDRKVK